MPPILQAVDDMPLHVSLRQREVLRLRGSGRLHCEAGEVWLTESGSAGDTILGAGQEWSLRAGSEVVLSSLAGARLCICGRPAAAA